LQLDASDVAEDREEAPVAIPGEALVLGPAHQAPDRLIVEAEIEDGIHHARHGGPSPRANGDEEGPLGIAQPIAHLAFEPGEIALDLRPQRRRVLAARRVIGRPRLGRDGEAGWNRYAEIGHLGQLAPLAAEQMAERARPLGLARREEVHVLRRAGRRLARPLPRSYRRALHRDPRELKWQGTAWVRRGPE
jgi:hypothetical protein